ncbi:cytosolic carboxypeptidase 3 isoform X6 [Hylobates moloch]|uniref:cytosolic carboxypeptidase 3 isoform X6 n=1 Tax=Hylobates moloch TaxID=81572 RepID=UPI00267575CB|nr:cytosolic carboxypeptidase 3 isoform X6 [Hylobates moloch]
MSEDSEKEDYSDRTISDEDESDEDMFMKFVSEDLHRRALLTADSFGDPFFPRTTQILLEYQLGRWVPRLREPRDLYGVSSSGPLSPTRWPYHCEVIDEKVQHIDWTPSCPEPVYIPTGLETEPLYPDSKEANVVYLAEDAYKEPCFVYSRVGGNRTPLKQPVDYRDNTLMFEARFESGNLQKVVKVLMEKREVILYCDLHGHSRKENIFMYGCDGSDRSKTLYLQQRIFPLMLSKNCPDKFSFSACKFNVQKSKEGTGRVVMWKMGIRNSFTMEATFCGSTLGNKRGTHFSTKDLESMGYHFCDSLLDYCDPDRTKYYRCLKELEEMERHITLEKVFEDSDTPVIDITLDVESSSRGSDSSESIDSLTYLLKLTSQKKHFKTKKERNSTIASHPNAREGQEVYDRGHLLQRHKQSNSDVKDTRPNEPDDYVVGYFRRQLPDQGLDLHHNLKSKIEECISFQSKKTGINWTDDEKRSYKDKGIVQTQEILQYLLPIMHSTKNMQTTQIKQLLNPRTNFQIQHQINPATCRNIKKYSTSWTAPRNHPFVIQGDVMANSSEWVQSKPHGSLESLSPLKGPKKNKNSQIWAMKNEDIKPLSSKWKAASSSFGMDANVLKCKSLQAEETNQQNSKHTALHLTKNKDEQANKNDGQPTLYLKFQRES